MTEVVEVSELVDCICIVCGNYGQISKEQFVCSAAPRIIGGIKGE